MSRTSIVAFVLFIAALGYLLSFDTAGTRKLQAGIYQLIATGQLKAVKSGRSTLVVYESLKQYAANLPVAKFRAPHGATPKA